jgi:hypothetical protein
VKLHASVCSQDDRHAVTWASEDVICWKCQGSGRCPDCRGAGQLDNGKACAGCPGFDDDGHAMGTGRCAQCLGKGLIRWGGAPALPGQQ